MRINFTTVKQFIALAILLKSAVACSSDELSFHEGVTPITKSNTPPLTEIYTDSTKNGAIVLSSEPVGNPYNVDTLKKAYALLFPNGRTRSATPEFTPTHYQLRFLPSDSLEFRNLMTSGLVFTTVPLDKKVAEEGTYYFDPVLEAQRAPYTWQYTIVPVTEELPNIRHEITAQICAPNDGTRGRSIDELSDIWPALEEKAYAMCGEEMPPNVQSRGAGLPGLPGEAGKFIYVWDDMANQYIPAKGAFVVAFGNSWSASTTTDEKGSYESLKIGGPITRMAIQWQDASGKWIVFDGTSKNDASKQAIYACSSTDPKSTYRIKGGKQQTFATMTRALYRMYKERNSFLLSGLIMPSNQSLKAVCIDGSSLDNYDGVYSLSVNAINVWGRRENGSIKRTHDIFKTTTHELGHMQHYMCLISNKNNWSITEKIIIESWASFVAWLVSELEYNELGYALGRSELLSYDYSISFPDASGLPGMPGQSPKNNTYKATTLLNRQEWPHFRSDGSVEDGLEYSPLFIDLVDSDNQRIYFRDHNAYVGRPAKDYKKYPNDLVRDYHFYDLEKAIGSALNLTQLKENIRNIPAGSSEKIKIDTLFNKYIYYWEKYK